MAASSPHKNDFFKNTVVLITGTVIAQIIPILFQPFLRRIYTAEEFGVFAIYFSLFSFLVVVASAKYDSVVVLPQEDKDASIIASAGLIISLLFSLIITIIILLFQNNIITLFKLPLTIKPFLLLLPLSLFFGSCYRVLSNWLIRKKKFKAASINKIVRRSSEGSVQLSLGYLKNTFGLFIGAIIGDFFNCLMGFYQAKKSGFKFTFHTEKTKTLLLKYKDFPLYNSLPTLLNTLSFVLPIFIINNLYTKEITGQFDLTKQMLALPIALISAAVSQVLIQKITELKQSRTPIKPLIIKTLLYLTLISSIGFILILLFGIDIFTFIFGNEWKLAGELSQILIFAFALKFVVSPLSVLFISLEKIKISSIWQIAYFIAICSLFFLKDISIKTFLYYYIYIELAAYFIYLILMLWVASKNDKQLKLIE